MLTWTRCTSAGINLFTFQPKTILGVAKEATSKWRKLKPSPDLGMILDMQSKSMFQGMLQSSEPHAHHPHLFSDFLDQMAC